MDQDHGESSEPVMPAPPASLQPQLVMELPSLATLPPLIVPAGYRIRHYRPGDAAAWDRIISESFGQSYAGHFERNLLPDPAFNPQRVLFACRDGEAVATASAWYRPQFGTHLGYVHYVGTVPAHAGRGLGRAIMLAVLHHMLGEGRTGAVLQTDDFRLPAIGLYLSMGFQPRLVHQNQRQRWQAILAGVHRRDLVEVCSGLLEAELRPPVPPQVELAVCRNGHHHGAGEPA